MNQTKTLENYQTASGKVPFQDWYNRLKDPRARLQITVRLDRAVDGNFGDWKSIKGTDGICEMRIKHGKGYRVYYRVVDDAVILLLIGSTKADQSRQIAKAKEYYEDYKTRNQDHD